MDPTWSGTATQGTLNIGYFIGVYQESSSLMLQDSLQEFAEIKRKYRDINFPLAFYGKG